MLEHRVARHFCCAHHHIACGDHVTHVVPGIQGSDTMSRHDKTPVPGPVTNEGLLFGPIIFKTTLLIF